MIKPKIYAEIPDYDQEKQAVYQLEPEERDDCIFYGIEIVDLPEEEPSEEDEL